MAAGYEYGNLTSIRPSEPWVEARPPFLVEGLVHGSVSLLYGMTNAGKSTLAGSLAIGVAAPDASWHGQAITRHGHVLVVAGDPDGEREWTHRLRQGHQADNSISLYAPNRPAIPQTWEEVRLIARQTSSVLVVLDNLSAFVPGSLNNDDDIKKLYDRIDGIARDGAAVLLLAHTSEKSGEYGPSRLPMGSSFIRFGPRWWIYVHRQRGVLLLDMEGNDGQPWQMTLTEPDGTPYFKKLGQVQADELAKRRRERTDRTKTKANSYQAFVLTECQHLNGLETAKAIFAKFGGKVATHQTQLSRRGYGVRRTANGQGWEAVREAP